MKNVNFIWITFSMILWVWSISSCGSNNTQNNSETEEPMEIEDEEARDTSLLDTLDFEEPDSLDYEYEEDDDGDGGE